MGSLGVILIAFVNGWLIHAVLYNSPLSQKESAIAAVLVTVGMILIIAGR